MLGNIERRYKICYIPENAFLNCLSLSASSPGDCLTKVSIEGVPPGTIAMYRGYSQERQKEYVVLWNATWPLVPESHLLPEIPVQTTYVQVRGSEPRRESACDQPLIRNAGTFTLERRDASGKTLESITFENPISITPDQELVLVGYHRTNSEPIGEARVTGKFPIPDMSESETHTCCPTRTAPDGKKECLYNGAWVPAATLSFEDKLYWAPAKFVNAQGRLTKELYDGIREMLFPTPAPKSIEDPFMKLWEEKGGLE